MGNPFAPVSNEIMFSVCSVINRCNTQVTIENCQAGVLATAGFATPLGLPPSTYSTLFRPLYKPNRRELWWATRRAG